MINPWYPIKKSKKSVFSIIQGHGIWNYYFQKIYIADRCNGLVKISKVISTF